MSGYLIAVIIMLIMFVALMIRLMQEPIEEPLLLKSAPPEPARPEPESAAADSSSSAGILFPPTVEPESDRPALPATQTAFEDPLDRMIAFEQSARVRPGPSVDDEPMDIESEGSASSAQSAAEATGPTSKVTKPEPPEDTAGDGTPPKENQSD